MKIVTTFIVKSCHFHFKLLIFQSFVFQIKENVFLLLNYLWLSNLVNYFCKQYWNINLFLSTWSLQNSETLNEYYYFHGNMVTCKSSIRICSYNRTQLNTGFITKALTSFKELTLILEANKSPLGKPPGTLFTRFIAVLPGKLRRLFLGQCIGRTSGYFGGLEKELTQTYRYCRQCLIASPCLGFSGLQPSEVFLSSIWRVLMKNSSKADLKEPMWLISILAGLIQIIRPILLKLDLFCK